MILSPVRYSPTKHTLAEFIFHTALQPAHGAAGEPQSWDRINLSKVIGCGRCHLYRKA